METDVGALSASELAELAGATEAAVERMVGLGILVARDGAGPFRAADVQGDYFGRTVNLAARIAAHAGAGQVLVSQSVADSAPPAGVSFVELGELPLKGFAHPMRVLEASRVRR